MTEEIVKILSVDAGDSQTSVKQLRKEIKLLKDELLNLDETSEEYNKVLGALSDRMFAIRDMNELARYSAADLGEQIATVNRIATGLASGFGAVQGAMALFGSESETLEKTMVRLQGVIALVQGLQGMEGLTKDLKAASVQFRNATASIKGFITGLSGIKKALLATGLGALVIVIGEVIANWDKISKLWKDTSPQDAATAAVDRLNISLSNMDFFLQQINLKALKDYNEALKNAGNNLEAIDAATKKYNETIRNNELESYSKQLKIAQEEASKLNAIHNDMSEDDEGYDEITKQLEEANKQVIKLSNSYQTLINKGYIEGANELRKLNSEINKNTQSLKDNQSEVDKQNIQKIKENLENSRKTELELLNDKYTEQKTLFQKYGEDITILTEEYEKQRKEIIEKWENKISTEFFYDIPLNSIDNLQEQLEEQLKKLDIENITSGLGKYLSPKKEYEIASEYINNRYEEQLKFYTSSMDILKTELDSTSLNEQQKYEIRKKYNELYISLLETTVNKEVSLAEIRSNLIKKEIAENKQKKVNIATTLSAISDLIGENTAAGKAAAVAGTLINTWANAEEAYRSAFNPGTIMSPALGATYMAAAIATGLANVKNILSVNTETGTGSSSSSAAATPSMDIGRSLPVGYTRNLLSNQETEDLNNSYKVYVTEADITTTQNKVNVVENNATF